MNRVEFMRRLAELLSDVPPAEREEAIQYYNDYFDDAGLENESSVIASLGTPEELARAIKAGLNDGGNGGEFTESGFSGYTRVHKDEVIRTGEAGTNRRSEPGSIQFNGNAGGFGASGTAANGGFRSNNTYYEDAYYQRTGGKGIYGGREDTRRQNSPYESADSSSYGQTGGSGYDQTAAFGSNTTADGSQTPPPKQGMSGGMIVLIVIAAVLTSPIWLGLLGGLFGLAVGILAAIFGIFIAFLAVGVVLVVVSIALLVSGIVMLFTVPLGGLCIIGTSLILFAVGLVFIWLMVFMAAIVIPALVKGISALGKRLFHRGGARA